VGENAAIAIILCKLKARTIVEYALRQSNQAIALCYLSNCVVFAVGDAKVL